MFGEFLYQLLPNEAQSAPVAQRWLDQVATVPAAAANFNLDMTVVPPGKILVIRHIGVDATAGAAQTVDHFQLRIRDELNNIIARLGVARSPAPAVIFDGYAWTGIRLILFPAERIQIAFQFNAGVAANTGRCTVSGILLPKGNLQLR